MKRYILCRKHFSNNFVKQIEAATPSDWHIVYSQKEVINTAISPNYLFVVSGSPTQQKEQVLKIRFGGGAAAGTFNVPLDKFAEFLARF